MSKKILSIFGTRPEAIKMAPVIKKLEQFPELQSIVCVTAQHRQMLDQVLSLFEIVPEYDLNLMKPGQSLMEITTQVLKNLEKVINQVDPDLVLVHGDTTTSFTAALSAFYAEIPVGHVEAGLRTYDLKSPYPEEANRQLTSRLTKLQFAPTETAKRNLIEEKIPVETIIVTGNTVIDALFLARKKLKDYSVETLFPNQSLQQVLRSSDPMLLVTGHRRENFGQGFINICEALRNIALQEPALQIVYPVHLNPNVQTPVKQLLQAQPNILLTEPLDYLPFVALLDRATLVLTDSGGIQEEAPSFGKPVLVMRNTTERPEALEAGTVRLVGTDQNKIVYWIKELLNNEQAYKKMSKAHNPYGDGKAAERIVKALISL